MGNMGVIRSKIIIVGLDNSGKSTMINFLKPSRERRQDVAATVGFKEENFIKGNIKFSCFDMSGQGKYRPLWERHYVECEAIIFVVDASDELRFPVAENELQVLLEHESISSRAVPILFFANKSDLPTAHDAQEIAARLKLT